MGKGAHLFSHFHYMLPLCLQQSQSLKLFIFNLEWINVHQVNYNGMNAEHCPYLFPSLFTGHCQLMVTSSLRDEAYGLTQRLTNVKYVIRRRAKGVKLADRLADVELVLELLSSIQQGSQVHL